jgi:hypothetical protein
MNWQLIGFGLLAVLAFSSKSIILYNEEILVGIAFLCFFAFCSSQYSATVADTLDARAKAIEEELQTGLRLQKDLYTNLLTLCEHQLVCAQGLQGLNTHVRDQLTTCANHRAQALMHSLHTQVIDQCDALAQAQTGMQTQFQHHMAKGLRGLVLESLKDSQPKTKQSMTNIIGMIGTEAKA